MVRGDFHLNFIFYGVINCGTRSIVGRSSAGLARPNRRPLKNTCTCYYCPRSYVEIPFKSASAAGRASLIIISSKNVADGVRVDGRNGKEGWLNRGGRDGGGDGGAFGLVIENVAHNLNPPTQRCREIWISCKTVRPYRKTVVPLYVKYGPGPARFVRITPAPRGRRTRLARTCQHDKEASKPNEHNRTNAIRTRFPGLCLKMQVRASNEWGLQIRFTHSKQVVSEIRDRTPLASFTLLRKRRISKSIIYLPPPVGSKPYGRVRIRFAQRTSWK